MLLANWLKVKIQLYFPTLILNSKYKKISMSHYISSDCYEFFPLYFLGLISSYFGLCVYMQLLEQKMGFASIYWFMSVSFVLCSNALSQSHKADNVTCPWQKLLKLERRETEIREHSKKLKLPLTRVSVLCLQHLKLCYWSMEKCCFNSVFGLNKTVAASLLSFVSWRPWRRGSC